MSTTSSPLADPMPAACDTVLQRASRPIAHLRERFRSRRLGLIFGAGISRDLDFPGWGELLSRIPKGFTVQFNSDVRDDLLRHAQLLFQHFCRHECADARPEGMLTCDDVLRIRWLERVYRCLYDGVPRDPNVLLQRSPYLRYFVPLIKGTRLAINYNFDDTLEQLLASDADVRGEPRRGYTTLWAANAQSPPSGGVIYHPNGFLPSQLPADQPSENLVLLQAAFADQIIDSSQGRYSFLTSYLSDMTCLIVGSSLTDPALQHVLRHTAQLHPGHVQYFVRYVRDHDALPPDRRHAEFDANFAVYNLVTLFLTADEIAALAALIGADESRFDEAVAAATAGGARDVRKQYVYYLVGSSGVGKTTALRHFYTLRPHEEWHDPLPEIMTRSFRTLNADELRSVDEWVDGQWRRKNAAIAESGSGVDLVDRGPLDSLAYVPPEVRAARAAHALSLIPKEDVPIVPGHVIRLHGPDLRVHAQARRVFRTHDLDGVGGIRWQQQEIAAIYAVPGSNASEVDIDGLTPGEVARRIARIIHTQEYRPMPLGDRLAELSRG